MDWFRVDSDVLRHPALFSLSVTLNMRKAHVLGHLNALWCGVAEHAESGDISKIDDVVIEFWAEWDGAPGAFIGALRSTGWVDSSGTLKGWAKRHEYMLRERKRKAEEYLKRTGSRARSPAEIARDSRARSARSPAEIAQPTLPYHLTSLVASKAATPTPPHNGRKKSTTPPDPNVAVAIKAYHDAHLAHTGFKPDIAGAKIGSLAKAALRNRPIERLVGLLPGYFARFPAPSAGHFFAPDTLTSLEARLPRPSQSSTAAPPMLTAERALKAAALRVLGHTIGGPISVTYLGDESAVAEIRFDGETSVSHANMRSRDGSPDLLHEIHASEIRDKENDPEALTKAATELVERVFGIARSSR